MTISGQYYMFDDAVNFIQLRKNVFARREGNEREYLVLSFLTSAWIGEECLPLFDL